jgi:O-methyltransferase involved in polyketide biosynthesis
MAKIVPQLGTIQETLLIPLYARARDATSRRPILNDTHAGDLIERLDYDFAQFGGPSLTGSVLRSAILDAWVRRFLAEHPRATVVELGTGLNTRFDRVDNGLVRWFDVDLPDTIKLRRCFFTDQQRRTMVVGSVLQSDWFDTIESATAGPYLFICEAVFPYLVEEQVRAALAELAQKFEGSLIAFDTVGAAMVQNQHRNGSMHAVAARMQWICEEPRLIEGWGHQLLEIRTFATPQADVAADWPLRYRYGIPLLARIMPTIVNSYKLNLFRLTGARSKFRNS